MDILKDFYIKLKIKIGPCVAKIDSMQVIQTFYFVTIVYLALLFRQLRRGNGYVREYVYTGYVPSNMFIQGIFLL